jgi:CHAT domain-containing protein
LEGIHSSVLLQRQALQLTPVGHPRRPANLNNLGNSLRFRFERLGAEADLDEAISSQREAVELAPEDDQDLPAILINLSSSLSERFVHTDNISDLNESISIESRAGHLMSENHPQHPIHLNNLSVSLRRRFVRLGDIKDIDEAIALQNQAIQRTPVGPDLSMRQYTLGISLQKRFERLAEMNDLDNAIIALQSAVDLTPEGHPYLLDNLNSLGAALEIRFQQLGELSDIENAIAHQRRVIALTPSDHPDLPGYLSSLGNCLGDRAERLGAAADMAEAIATHKQAIDLTATGPRNLNTYLNNLAAAFLTRFDWLDDIADLDSAISAQRQAIETTPDGHPAGVRNLHNMGVFLRLRYERLKSSDDFDSAISAHRQCALSIGGDTQLKIECAREWASLAHSTDRLSLALEGYSSAINLLPQAVWIGHRIEARQKFIAKVSKTLAVDAAACAIQLGDYPTAVELLDHGRSVFWSQASEQRTDLAELYSMDRDLAAELETLGEAIEQATFQVAASEIDISTNVNPELDAVRHRRNAERWETLVGHVRSLPKLANFLKPTPFSQLRQAAVGGAVVLLNISQYRCDALIISSQADSPVRHVSLPDISKDEISLHAQNLRDGENSGEHKWFEKNLRVILQLLWAKIFEPIVAAFPQMFLSADSVLPRRWFCPTGPLTFLPLHAAGPYVKGGGSDISKRVVFSYTSTLSALLRSRSRPPSSQIQMLLVGQSSTPNQVALPNAAVEISAIRKLALERGIEVDCLEGADATALSILTMLDRRNCAHFACHGQYDPNSPLSSALLLHDQPLYLTRIASKRLISSDFAFLSACHTASGSDDLPDEAMHLAAGLQFAGYRSIIATMWAMGDESGPVVTQSVYNDLLPRNDLIAFDSSNAAVALNRAVRQLRKSNFPLHQWLSFVHIGA